MKVLGLVIYLAAWLAIIIGLCCFLDALLEGNGKVGIFAIGMLVLCILLFVLYGHPYKKCDQMSWQREDPYVTHSLIALSDGNEINGRIRGSKYSMSGYINEKFTYVYGYKTYGGGMKIQKAGADTTVVYFRDDIDPCAKWYKETKKYWWAEDERYTCDIFIPTDSLEAKITIDLE